MRISTRRATDGDADFVYAVTEASMRGYAEQTFGSWTERQARDSFWPAMTQIIRVGEEDVGLVEIEDEQNALTVGKLYLLPGHQNRGVGSRVLKQILDRAGQEGRCVRLRVLRVNPAKRFYERHGFRVVDSTHERFFMEWRDNDQESHQG